MSEIDRPCPDYRPGHQIHYLQSRLAGRTPWGWRDGVMSRSADGVHVVTYVFEAGEVEVWSALRPALAVGMPVRLHERLHVLDVAGTWLNVEKRSPGLGAVPEPEDPIAWSDAMGSGVVDLATGAVVDPTGAGEPD